MSLNLYFCQHAGEETFTQQFEQLFSQAGIVVLEEAAVYSVDLLNSAEERWNALSEGKVTPEQIMAQEGELIGTDEDYFKRMNEKIYRSRKRICLERSPLSVNEIRRMNVWNLTNKNYLSKHYLRDYLRAYRKNLSFRADCARARDRRFAVQLAELQRNNVQAHILTIRGAVHQASLEKFLREARVQAESHLADSRLLLLIELEIISKLAVGKRADDRDLLKAAVQTIEIQQRTADKTKMKLSDIEITHELVTRMSEAELQQRLYRWSRGFPLPISQLTY
jgi:hypothetical protein